jgi:hypothetical protein
VVANLRALLKGAGGYQLGGGRDPSAVVQINSIPFRVKEFNSLIHIN